ncbi:MAG: HAD-IA family hydrolase [Bacteroidaceae bacterium]|nr:HAD-IA family hydrolase [Bacteroidaceae bacterium]
MIHSVLFDMDGVLFDSMPAHAASWAKVCTEYGLKMSVRDVYLNEGRTALSTIEVLTQRTWGRSTNQEEVDKIYSLKCEEFKNYPEAPVMPGATAVLDAVLNTGQQIYIVTGSAQDSLLDRIYSHFPGYFVRERVVSGKDYTLGKPNPEPYLIGLKRAGVTADEAIVVENAPLGVRAAKAAGIRTIAVNTGILDDADLLNEGADWVFPSMAALAEAWSELQKTL